MAFLVCYSWSPPDDHARHSAIYLDQQFYELIFKRCRSMNGRYIVLREVALLTYKSPILIVSGERLALLIPELRHLDELGLSHPQIGELRRVCNQAISDGCALTISGDMYPELWIDEVELDPIKSAIAEHVKSVNLSDMTVSPTIIGMVPESVARENVLMPIGEENGVLQIVMSDPSDYETLMKLQYILARDIQPVLAPEEQIVAAINRHYGRL